MEKVVYVDMEALEEEEAVSFWATDHVSMSEYARAYSDMLTSSRDPSPRSWSRSPEAEATVRDPHEPTFPKSLGLQRVTPGTFTTTVLHVVQL